MWNIIQKGYQEADKKLGGWLPGGGTGNPLSNFAREEARKTGADQHPVIRQVTDRNDAAKAINTMQQENERQSSSKPNAYVTPTDQINLTGPQTTQVKMCPVNRDSYKLAKSAVKNYRMNTQNTPDNAMNGCVESVQRNFDDAGLPRVGGADSWFRDNAGNTDELRTGLTSGGRGYAIDISSAGPGDVVIQNGVHAGIVTDRKDGKDRYLVNSNSGSHGSFSNVIPLANKEGAVDPRGVRLQGTNFEVFRLGQPPVDPVRPVGGDKFGGVNMTSGVRSGPPPLR